MRFSLLLLIVIAASAGEPAKAFDGRWQYYSIVDDAAGEPVIAARVFLGGYRHPPSVDKLSDDTTKTPDALVRRKMAAGRAADQAALLSLYVADAAVPRRDIEVETFASSDNQPKLVAAKARMVSRAHFSAMAFLFWEIDLGGGDVQPMADFAEFTGGSWHLTTTLSTLEFAWTFLEIQSTLDTKKALKEPKIDDRFRTAVASVARDGELRFPAQPGDPYAVTIAYRLATGPTVLEPYTGSDPMLADLASLIAAYRAGASIPRLNARWRLPSDVVITPDKAVDPMFWYEQPLADDTRVSVLGVIATRFGPLVVLADSRSIVAVVPRRVGGGYEYALRFEDEAGEPLNNMLFWDRSILRGLK